MRVSKRQTSLLRQLANKNVLESSTYQKRFVHQKGVNFKATFSDDLANPHTSFPVAAVFGASGFLGRYITASLADIGYQVIVPHRYSDYKVMAHRVMGDVGQIVTMRFSPDKYDTIVDICARSNLVVNVLGRDIDKIFDNSMEYSNVFCTEQIAKACKDTAVDRLIHVSHMGADVSHPSTYLRQKGQGEEIVKKYFPQATIVRPAPVFGTEDRYFNWIAKCIRLLPGVPLINGGRAKTQPVYCVDVGDAIANTVALHQTEGKIVELAGPETYSWDQLVDIIGDMIGEVPSRLPTPAIAAYAFGAVNRYTWKPAFTVDFARRMQYDIMESTDRDVLKFKDVGITPQRIETAAHEYLARWKRNPDYFLDVNYKK